MKTVLVTGALGFCARPLIAKLHGRSGLRVFGIDMAENAPSDVLLDEYASLNICDQGRFEHYIKVLKPDSIFHLAGIIGDNSFDTYNVNFVGSLYLLESVRKHVPGSRVLLVGSSAEYGFASPDELPLVEDRQCRPVSAYGISKHAMVLAGLDYARSCGLKIVVARPFNIVGPGIPTTLVVGAILKRIEDSRGRGGKPAIKMGNLDTQRDFVDVDDAVDAYIKMADGDSWGEVFNICSGKPCSIREIVGTIASFLDPPLEIKQDPALMRRSDVQVSFGSYEKARSTFGFVPTTDIKATLLKTWRYHIERGTGG